MKTIEVPAIIRDNKVAVFISHSGGKDSQACYAQITNALESFPNAHIVVVHSDLGEMEWEPMGPWIEAITHHPLHIVEANETFFELCLRTGRLPSGNQQYCTDFLKTKPICEFIHQYMNKHGYDIGINATGMRAEESKRRELKPVFGLSKGEYTSDMHQPKKHPNHTIYDWNPIKDFLVADVLETIEEAGQAPHSIYSMGFSRLSCVFCVNGRIEEHKKAAMMRPELAKKFAELERKLGKTLRMKQIKNVKYPKYLDEYTDLKPLTIEENGQIIFDMEIA